MDARRLLDRIPALRSTCDLDLVLFFARHPRTLMASEQLARRLGYTLGEIARSLDVLLEAGLLTRTQNPTGPARMFAFAPDRGNGGWLPELMAFAGTREGRLSLRRALTERPSRRTSRLAPHSGDAPSTPDSTAVGSHRRKPSRIRQPLSNAQKGNQ